MIREQDPLKQGLKRHASAIGQLSMFIREQDPLKQGLKLSAGFVPIVCGCRIREQDPLKQGLKH